MHTYGDLVRHNIYILIDQNWVSVLCFAYKIIIVYSAGKCGPVRPSSR